MASQKHPPLLGSERQCSERRMNIRYALGWNLAYAVLSGDRRGESGTSQIIDMSSSGIRFLAEQPLERGFYIEVVINWPALLEGRVPLQLVASGVVVRTNGTETALRLERHVFKTRKAQHANGLAVRHVMNAVHS